ncbi:MAG: bifunctional D-glycero-beta-D-manno-heptose-7-phosphate kinase/D-glycero-beta-D-manno-heptose 1-phosphate adenylyltransferase HldE [Gammaproteobacteria bacterium]|nr:bifunctional D-glycero-beta-D-manno-heptose-7-phosphate kinase/D-glycero-beta-D-manno-heptose 1-phosphate adenylyltransferase HldE [Gammaproteobacteria bacterium]
MYRQLQDMTRARVLVVGDLILDRYWHGATRRISPEAPVPVVHVQQSVERVGGAANVAANVIALGGQAMLVGIVGGDAAGATLATLCRDQGIEPGFVVVDDEETIVKLRVVSQHQQLVRVDFERDYMGSYGGRVLELFAARLADCDIVVLSDYGKGTLADAAQFIERATAAGKPVIVDPKGSDFLRYKGASVLTPNLHEFETVVGRCADDADLVAKGAALVGRVGVGTVLVTRGEAGMSLVDADGLVRHVPAEAHDVFDVTGAGDTVCGVMATALAAGAELAEAVSLANAAAGIVVGKFGAATVSADELDRALARRADVRRGVVDRASLLVACRDARRRGDRIVFTNGCFDILHEGHVRYLAEARTLGQRLVVAVNDDASVARLKGAGRPVNPLAARMAVLAALEVVDWVVPFTEDTPRQLVAELAPDVLVKGGDYRVEDIAGGDEVRAAGGEVVVLEYHEGCSTSAIIERAGQREPAP